MPSLQSIRTAVVIPLVVALALLSLAADRAAASTITWEYDLTVQGTATGVGDQPIVVPANTPMVIDVTFDTDSEDYCGSDPYSAFYFISAATVNVLGYQYSVSQGGLEINTIVGECTENPVFTDGGVRLFVSDNGAVQTDPSGTEIDWPNGMYGILFLEFPPSAWLGAAFPTGLAPEPSPFGGNNFINYPGTEDLTIDSTEISLVPEPATAALIASGVCLLLIRRQRQHGS